MKTTTLFFSLALVSVWGICDAVAGDKTRTDIRKDQKASSPHHKRSQTKPKHTGSASITFSTVAAPGSIKAGVPPVPAKPASSDDAALGFFGTSLRGGDISALVMGILPDSRASELGLRTDDRLAFLNGAPVRSRGEAAMAWRGWKNDLRLWAVARRELGAISLESPLPDEKPLHKRGAGSLSPLERRLLAARLGEAEDAAKQAWAQAPSLSVTIPARQSFWIRFPEGIKKTVAAGDILQGEVTMAVAADANLDFLCVPPHSLIWGRVLEASAPTEGTRVLRIRFFKTLFTGGHTIPLSAHITDVAGEQPMIRITLGGSLIIGEPVVADPKERKRTPLLKSTVRLRVELDDPATITEPPKFYLAGPGAWIKTLDTETGRGFEVTHVIAGRSAEKMGLRVGDILTAIDGRSCAKLEFEDALAALYGTPGSTVKVVAAQKAADKPRPLELKRGVFYKDGVETPTPLPFEKTTKK